MIAVIEDDESMRGAVRRLLKSEGFDAAAYGSAEDFLRDKELGDVECLILDVCLPGMSGIELFQQLKAGGSMLPAVFMTAQDSQRTRQQVSLMASLYLVKPFTAEAFLDAVRRATASAGSVE